MIEGPTVMYSTHQQPQPHLDSMVGNVIDGSGTINPAALNQSGILPTPTSLSDTSPRGVKRSRSPDQYGDANNGGYDDDNDDSRPSKKRGRPPKERGPDDLVLHNPGQSQPGQLPTPISAISAQSTSTQHSQLQQGQQQPPPPPQPAAPKQGSPTKTPAGKQVVKALPTVRDHTTDQLNVEKDEYMPREVDDAGENKVAPNGKLQGGREYKCRTFLVPNRGDKLFMLATECARILGYRDSYLLFNKNRSLYKIIAVQSEKDDLIHQDILPYSYRSRQIAIVTAKSMFRQFGSRVVVNGRRVRDDYWEAKARKQGFTEDDLAGEKRPGAAKREAQASEAAHNVAIVSHHAAPTNIDYVNVPGGPQMPNAHMIPGYNSFLPGMEQHRLPMIDPMYHSDRYNDMRTTRHDISGTAQYQERPVPATTGDIMSQATQASDYNKGVTTQRAQRANILNDYWKKEHPVSSPVQDSAAAPAPALASPHMTMSGPSQQAMLPQQGAQSYPSHAASGQGSPQAMRQQPPSMPQRSSTMGSGYGGGVPPSPSSSYTGYSSGYMQQPQQSPMTSQHSLPGYGPPHTPGHPQPSQSPHPSQSPQHMSHAQGGHTGQPGMLPPNQGYAVPPMASMPQNYGAQMGRQMYPAQPSPHQYMANSTPGAPAGMNPGWQGAQQNWQPQY